MARVITCMRGLVSCCLLSTQVPRPPWVRNLHTMAYAALVQVEIDPDSDHAHRQSVLTQFVLPEVEALPGFRSAVWLDDGEGVGTCIVRFDTEEQARRSLVLLAPQNGPRVLWAVACAVELEAPAP
jgi:hypothetical protein